MTDLLSWRDDWCLGIDWVDADHREMAVRLNRLADAVRAAAEDSRDGAAKQLVLRRFDELVKHNRAHFAVEEAFLLRIGYPGFDGHRREHHLELAELIDLRRTLAEDDSSELDIGVLEEFKHWFFNHVIAEDRAYAEYYLSLPPERRGE